MFESLEWAPDERSFALNGFSFRVAAVGAGGAAIPAEDSLTIYKPAGMLREYDRLFSMYPIDVDAMVELGIWDGGAIALFAEVLDPGTLLAFDIDNRGDSPYFQRYLVASGRSESVKTHWGVDQADGDRLRAALTDAGVGRLDLVIDDASHLYRPTVASFVALFGRLRPGGLYVIEDWNWSFNEWGRQPFYQSERPLVSILSDIVGLMAGAGGAIASVTVMSGFITIERGAGSVPEPLDLRKAVNRRPDYRWYAARKAPRRYYQGVRRRLRRASARVRP